MNDLLLVENVFCDDLLFSPRGVRGFSVLVIFQ